ncbi:MAG TPA: response regulator [Bryobacteraceae bacterium]|nr:response regulator [Bryobacteraceae bacterium]
MVTRILVAEDNPADVYLLREAFGLQGEQVEMIVVTDGEQALDFVQKQGNFANSETPDLVVLDLNLPKSEGSDVLRCIRGREEYKGVPVVVLTSSDSPRDRKTIESLGASCFITKPSDLDSFLALGRTLMGFIGAPFTNRAHPVHAT